ncbi:MAG: family 43 glycosylhydrolase [Christensenellaceae bacterium]|nr:family 43 glycosylhydrolase [Christensenellaceae bacterium]
MTKRTRSADLGNGTYLNPIMFGHYSDPSVLRDGEDYYMMTGESMLYHSQDLVNWDPMYTLYPQTSKYDVHHPWAPDISKHGDTYYYYAFANTEKHLLFVMTTKDIKNGPWTDPIIMGSAGFTEDGDELIDPALVFDLAGKPHLMMSKNCMYPLTDDGLALAGDFVQVADDPPIPDEFDVEGVYTEGPKFCYHGGYYYMMVAAGGTMGPATAHGTYAYRAKDIHGPWELSPYNPISHTASYKETWWSKGHASFIDTPDGEWYIMQHGPLKDYLEQGRMLLLEPIEWTDDGWFRIPEWAKTDEPLPMPKNGKKVTHGYALKADVHNKKLDLAWEMQQNIVPNERFRFTEDGIYMKAEGEDLNTSEPLLYSVGFPAYEAIAEFEVGEGVGAGLTAFTVPHACCGIALKDGFIRIFDQDKPLLSKRFNLREWNSNKIFFKIRYVDHVVSHWYSADGENWTKLNICAYVGVYCPQSGFNVNGKTWLRPGIFAYGGEGEALVKSFEVREIEVKD